MKRKLSIFVALILSALLLTACGSKAGREYPAEMAPAAAPAMGFSNKVQADYAMEEAAMDGGYATSASGAGATVEMASKLIRNIYLEIEVNTSDTIQAAANDLGTMAKKQGGYVTNNSSSFEQSYAYANIVVKVPAAKADAFLSEVEENGYKVSSIQDSVDDVTMEYTDVTSRLAVKEAAKEKYMKYLKDAETVEEILEIEDRLNDTIEEIESAKARLNVLNSQIDFTTISINIRCRSVVEKQSFWDKAARRLGYILQDAGDSVLDGLDWIVNALIWLIFVTPVAFIVLKLLNVILKATGFRSKNSEGFGKKLLGKMKKKSAKKQDETANVSETQNEENAQK